MKILSGESDRAWAGVMVLFLAHGLVVASWLSRIPGVQITLKLSNGILGLTLLSAALGAVCVIPSIGSLIVRYGSRRISLLSSVGFCLSVVLPGLAVNALTLAAALFIYGGFAAAMDVAMNAQGVEVENVMGKPTMSRFHAMFSGGAMLGASLGGVFASRNVPFAAHFLASGVVNLILILSIGRWLIADRSHAHPAPVSKRLRFRNIPPVLLALSAIAFCALLSEGALADWTAVYLRQQLAAGPGTAAAGYAIFSGTMASFRFLGDWITQRLGPLLTVRVGCLLGAVGLSLALMASSPSWSFPGFGLCGIGFSVVIPLIFGGGGRVPDISPGAGIATVTGIGYLGFIVGPPAIGFASQLVTLRIALGIVVLCCVVAALLAGYMRMLQPISPQPIAARPATEVHF